MVRSQEKCGMEAHQGKPLNFTGSGLYFWTLFYEKLGSLFSRDRYKKPPIARKKGDDDDDDGCFYMKPFLTSSCTPVILRPSFQA
eukprot:g46576.t1